LHLVGVVRTRGAVEANRQPRNRTVGARGAVQAGTGIHRSHRRIVCANVATDTFRLSFVGVVGASWAQRALRLTTRTVRPGSTIDACGDIGGSIVGIVGTSRAICAKRLPFVRIVRTGTAVDAGVYIRTAIVRVVLSRGTSNARGNAGGSAVRVVSTGRAVGTHRLARVGVVGTRGAVDARRQADTPRHGVVRSHRALRAVGLVHRRIVVTRATIHARVVERQRGTVEAGKRRRKRTRCARTVAIATTRTRQHGTLQSIPHLARRRPHR